MGRYVITLTLGCGVSLVVQNILTQLIYGKSITGRMHDGSRLSLRPDLRNGPRLRLRDMRVASCIHRGERNFKCKDRADTRLARR
jgi:hypothetical protein